MTSGRALPLKSVVIAQLGDQRVVRDVGYVGDVHALGVALATGRAHGDEVHALSAR